MLLQLFVILGLVPGVFCDNYNIGYLIATASVAFILLIVVVAMLIIAFWWESWFNNYQMTKGRVKVTREWLKQSKIENKNSVIAADQYEMNGVGPHRYKGIQSVHSTFPPESEAADWIHEVTTNEQFEVKTKAMEIGEEDHEEPLIITEVLRDSVGNKDALTVL
ncbi:hypothetical protein ScPMuIL_003760 [Solemya velum]